jgi:hypothetical protein
VPHERVREWLTRLANRENRENVPPPERGAWPSPGVARRFVTCHGLSAIAVTEPIGERPGLGAADSVGI